MAEGSAPIVENRGDAQAFAAAEVYVLDGRLRGVLTRLFMRLLAGEHSEETLALARDAAQLAEQLDGAARPLLANEEWDRDLAALARDLEAFALSQSEQHGNGTAAGSL